LANGKVVCLDTQILIWGLKKQAKPEQQDEIAKAEYFLKKCDEEKTAIIIPSVVIAELLAGIPLAEHGAFLGLVNKRFMIASFDLPAAAIYGEYFESWRAAHPDSSFREEGFSRVKFKVDHMILAIAVTRDANCLYTNDDELIAHSNGRIEARKLPKVLPQQQPLF
jgi:predicted nucleic acid-binding protein